MAAPTGRTTSTDDAGTAEQEQRATRRESRSRDSKDPRSASRERRSRSKSADRPSSTSTGTGTSGSANRSSSRSRHGSRTQKSGERARSKSRERSRQKSRATDEDDDNELENGSLVRRRRRNSTERSKSKTGSYLNGRKQEKDNIKGRKSSVLGSLHAFLEEGAEAPAKSTDAKSVASSASRIRRRKSTAGSASVVGGVVSSREEMKASRRQAKDPQRRRSHSDGPLERSGSNRRSLGDQPRSGSHGNLRKNTTSPKHNRDDERNSHSTPDDNPRRQQRRSSMTATTGAEVPPGFPAAAVNSVPHDVLGTSERSTSSVPSGIAESTAQIRGRQQRRSSMTGGSTLDPDVDHFRKARRRSSMDNTSSNTPQSGVPPMATEPAPPPPETVGSPRRKSRHHSTSAAPGDDIGGPSNSGKGRQNRKKSLPSATAERVEASAVLGTKLATVNDAKDPKKPSKTDNRNVASAPVHISKHSSNSKRRSKQNSEGKSLTRKESRSKLVSAERKSPLESLFENEGPDLPPRGHSNSMPTKENMEDLMGCSMSSLDPSLLHRIERPGAQISSIAELYSEDNREENGNSGSIALGEKFRNQYGNPQDHNQSNVSFDSTHFQKIAVALGGTASGASTPRSGSDGEGLISPGCLRRKIGQASAVSPRVDKRVSWVELPLHNPEELLVKSTSTDGTNETVTMTTADAVPNIANNNGDDDDSDQDIEPSSFSLIGEESECSGNETKRRGTADDVNVSTASKESKSKSRSAGGSAAASKDKDSQSTKTTQSKPNRSLDEALKRENEIGSMDNVDERTVATSATGNTNNTSTSERTVKTANRSSSSDDIKSTVPKGHDTSDYHDSITTADLADDLPLKDESSTSLRSSGSGSSSSLGRRRGKDEASGKPEKRKSSSTKSKSRSNAGKESTRSKEGESRDQRRAKLSKERSRSNISGDIKRKSKPNEPDKPLSSGEGKRKPGEKIKFRPAASVQPSGEVREDPSDDKDSKPKLKLNTSISTEDGIRVARRRSYLPRNTAKGDKHNSKEQRNSIKSSLDRFLEHLDDTGPIIKDDNRSVYSELQDKDRKKRIRDKKREESGTTRIQRMPRQKSRTNARGTERHTNDDDDNMSILSAPMFTSKQVKKRLEEMNRPVINLKETHFSSKLHKLHVAF